MKDKVKQLAERAGFVLWNNEEWKPEGQVIDWSCDYDKELEKFAELIVKECANAFEAEVDTWKESETMKKIPMLERFAAQSLVEHDGELIFSKEKFAELIVRECIDIVSPYAIRMENFDGGHPIVDLKKHFGVEQ